MDLWGGRSGLATGALAAALVLLGTDALVNGQHTSFHRDPVYVNVMGSVLFGLIVAAAALAGPFQRRVFLPVYVTLFAATVVLSLVEARLGNQALETRDTKVSHVDAVLFEPGLGAMAGLLWWAVAALRGGRTGTGLALVGFTAGGAVCYVTLR